jgi:hypothetical protein
VIRAASTARSSICLPLTAFEIAGQGLANSL